jgi:hypothetical protein
VLVSPTLVEQLARTFDLSKPATGCALYFEPETKPYEIRR